MDKILPTKPSDPNDCDHSDYAKKLRNADDYDDWNVGLEPIPFDCTWAAWTGKS
jgi:hypothetical protein